MTSMSFLSAISFIGYAVEVVGVVIILLGMGKATVAYIRRYIHSPDTDRYHIFRREMGRAMANRKYKPPFLSSGFGRIARGVLRAGY